MTSQISLQSSHHQQQVLINPQSWILPGLGDPGKKCLDITPILACECCMKIHYVRHRCNQKACPNCWETWHINTTANIKSRICSIEAKIKNGKFKKIRHVVVSPTPELVEKYDYLELRKQATEYLYEKSSLYAVHKFDTPFIHLEKYGFKKLGGSYTISNQKWKDLAEETKEKIRKTFKITLSAPSGVLIWHPYRIKSEYQDQYKEYLRTTTDKPMKKWEWVRSKKNWMDLVTYSPHFHYVGYTGFLEPSKKGESFGYKTIEEKTENGNKKVKALSQLDVYRVANYLLTHTASLKDKQYTHGHVWIGNLSTRNGNSGLIEEDIPIEAIDLLMNKKDDTAIIKKKIECKWCKQHGKRGKLRFMWTTLKSWLGAYDINVEGQENINWDTVTVQVKNLEIPPYLMLHVLEAIKVKRGKPPPSDWEDYLIEVD